MVEIKIPRENANDDSVLVSKVAVKNGDYVEKDDLILEFETSKATIELTASESGFISFNTKVEGVIVKVDQVIGSISEKKLEFSTSEVEENNPTQSPDLIDKKISKKAHELLASGSQILNDSHWITSKSFTRNTTVNDFKPESKPVEPIKTLPNCNYEVQDNSHRKQLEIQALRKSSEYLNSTLGISLQTNKRRLKNLVFGDGILDLLVYEINNLISSEYSDLNCFYINDAQIGYYKDVKAGIALDTSNNLSVISISKFRTLTELQDLLLSAIVRFDEQKPASSDFLETTFTVSDLSSTSLDFMLPLINGQQAFIIGVTKSKDGFRLHGTFDHRVTAGRRFGSFLEELKTRIELYFSGEDHQLASAKNCYYCYKSLEEEKSLGNRGLIKIDDGSSEKLICRNCFEGW